MCRNGDSVDIRRRRRRRGLATAAALALAGWLGAAPAAAQQGVSSPQVTGIELSAPVQQALLQLQEQWLQWIGANSRARAASAVDGLLATSRQLGMTRLPDLSLGALVQAGEAARAKDFRRARWSLEAAERLDPMRPETAFARAEVDRLEGGFLAAFASVLDGYRRLFLLPLERYLWLQDLLLWSLCLVLLTGGLFIALQMGSKGGALLRDFADLLARSMPRGAALAVAVVLLLVPLALPYGPLWLLLSWSLLLWGYASKSERSVLISLWLLMGLAPFVLTEQRRRVALELSPPVQAMESLARGRLYGALFTDLGVLRSKLPESPAVKHLLADAHRSLNQWELARSLYRQVLEKEPGNTSALLNLGAYFFFKGDFGGAIEHFQKAAAADPASAAAQFNLSQAYSESYLFDESRRALAQARAIDDARVNHWIASADQQRVVTAQGGMARVGEIRRQLRAGRRQDESAVRRLEVLGQGLSAVLALGLVLLAVALHLARRRFGYTQPPGGFRLGKGGLDRLRRVLVPGMASAEAGRGGRAFLALLVPVGLLMIPLAGKLGYRIPWGYDPGDMLPWTLSLLGLLVYLGLRLRRELADEI